MQIIQRKARLTCSFHESHKIKNIHGDDRDRGTVGDDITTMFTWHVDSTRGDVGRRTRVPDLEDFISELLVNRNLRTFSMLHMHDMLLSLAHLT